MHYFSIAKRADINMGNWSPCTWEHSQCFLATPCSYD